MAKNPDTIPGVSGKKRSNAPFGSLIAEHMAVCEFDQDGWTNWRLETTAPLSLHPAAHVLHYASSCFEGLKAYRKTDGGAHIFRLRSHAARMRQSAALLCLPFPGEEALAEMILGLTSACRDIIPAFPGSLYLRPTLIGTQAHIGAAAVPSSRATLFVIASPVGDYFEGGERPLRVLVEQRESRSTRGFGLAKTGGNYASALRHIVSARANHRADQVLFCPDGDVQETGASNFLLLRERGVLTKRLDSSYLHGVTRDSVLRLAERSGYAVEERDFSVDEMLDWIPSGEAALSGTAAVLAGVGTLIVDGEEIRVGDGGVGKQTRRLREALNDIQAGEAEDPFGWLTPV